jgi:23S rRNA (uracil1939-C5)-methyltransferase
MIKRENMVDKLNCNTAKKCGGCKYRTQTYEEQLSEKQKMVSDNLRPFCKVEKIIGMETPFHYRNKVHAVFSYEKGQVISGTYQEGTHRVVPVEKCMIEDEKADEIVATIRKLLKSFKIKTYDEDTGYGLLRHVLIRTGKVSGQIMVVLVLSSPILPSKNNFIKALRKEHPEITTIVLNVNNKKTSMILGEKETVLYGKGYIEDILCDVRFRISSKSFYQINHTQTEVLYRKAMEYAGLTGKERIVDAYCGIGTIGLIAAKDAKEVIAVELNPDAVRDAVNNAKVNDIRNVQFYQNDAGKFMVQMAQEGVKADVVFMDPPRAGSDEAFLSSVVQLSPKRIVYVSCNPVTLGRDLKYLTKKGYQVKKAQPVDMFPWSEHVETVVLLSRKPQ